MTPAEGVSWGISLLNAVAAVLICVHLGQALRQLPDISAAQRRAVEGILVGMSLLLAGTILKTMLLGSWASLQQFAAILLIRTGMKQAALWQQALLSRTTSPGAGGTGLLGE